MRSSLLKSLFQVDAWLRAPFLLRDVSDALDVKPLRVGAMYPPCGHGQPSKTFA